MRVSEEFLIDALYLPKDTRIVGVSVDWHSSAYPVITFIVNHSDISTDDVFPIFEAEYDAHHDKIIKFIGWT